jgi:acetyl esterase/lipase
MTTGASRAPRSGLRGMLRTALVCLVPFAGGCTNLFFHAVNAGSGAPEPVTRTYAPDRGLALDVYVPKDAAPTRPVALFFYGGSWRRGQRAEYGFVGRALAREGILTLVVDYRLYPSGAFPRFEEDAAAAVKWAKTHAAEFGGDPAHLFLVGHSAGGHIVALLATDGRYLAAEGLKPRDLAGVVGIAGPYDFLPLTDPDIRAVFGPEAGWAASQPVNFVDGDEPPFLLLQGTGDHVVAPKNADALARRLEAAGEKVELVRYPGIGHFRILLGMRYPRLAPTLRDTARFIKAAP